MTDAKLNLCGVAGKDRLSVKMEVPTAMARQRQVTNPEERYPRRREGQEMFISLPGM